ncbi:MAG: higA-2 [Phycisphaerales bacterium]|nr:higA-2 [Phycisphaerales bacterium]
MKPKTRNPAPRKASASKPAARSSTGGRKLMAALDDILAAERGEPGRVIVREVEITEPGAYPPAKVRALRGKLGVTQRVFARLVGVSPELVEHWEQGITEPRPLARRLLDRISENPPAYLKAVVREQLLSGAYPGGAGEQRPTKRRVG